MDGPGNATVSLCCEVQRTWYQENHSSFGKGETYYITHSPLPPNNIRRTRTYFLTHVFQMLVLKRTVMGETVLMLPMNY